VSNQIRAMQPWPTAYTYLHRAGAEPVRLIVQRAAVVVEGAQNLDPGTVRADGEILRVVCHGGTVLKIIELQPAGKRRMSAQDFLRGNTIPPDAHFR